MLGCVEWEEGLYIESNREIRERRWVVWLVRLLFVCVFERVDLKQQRSFIDE